MTFRERRIVKSSMDAPNDSMARISRAMNVSVVLGKRATMYATRTDAAFPSNNVRKRNAKRHATWRLATLQLASDALGVGGRAMRTRHTDAQRLRRSTTPARSVVR